MSHTPGPWKVDEDGFVWGCCPGPAFMKEAHFLIAEVRGWGYLQYRAGGERIQAANARLIAAAPELLECLKHIQGIVSESQGVAGWHQNGQVASWDELGLREEIDAVLAKVRGEVE